MYKIRFLGKAFATPMLFILFIISLVLYIQAPYSYEYSTCITCLVLYFVAFFILMIKVYRGQLLSFELFFSLAFIYVNFIYGIFLYNINANFSLFKFSFNEEYITKCTCLALTGYIAYAFFRSKSFKDKINTHRPLEIKTPKWILVIFCVFTLLSIVSYVSYMGTAYDDIQRGSLVNLMREILNVIVFYLLLAAFYNNKKFKNVLHAYPLYFWVLLGALMLFQLLCGYRTDPMRYALVSLFAYSYFCKRVSFMQIVIILVIGLFTMHVVGNARSGEGRNHVEISENELVNMGEDLIINNRSLYVLTELADKKGCSYGKTFMMNIFSVVPFAQTIIPPILGWNINDLSTPLINTYQTFNVGDKDLIGLGTNLIGDLYYTFGLAGVLTFMGLLGILIRQAEANMYRSFGFLLIYAMFFSNAIYYTRAEYLNLLRIITWIYILYYFINKKTIRNVHNLQ